jgi:cobalamin transport system substrate-binding protein
MRSSFARKEALMATHPRRFLGPAVLAVLALVFVGTACGGGTSHPAPSRSTADSAYPLTMTDDDGVSATLTSQPRRIVTFSESDTEIVYALGLGSRLVGVAGPADNYPPAARKITHVGGGEFGTELNVEKVVSLHADIVLYSFGSAPWMAQLRKLGIPVFTTHSTTVIDAMHDIDTIGRLLGVPAAALSLTTRMRRDAGLIERSVAQLPAETCFLEVGYNPLYTVGPGSLEYDLLRKAGCRPVTLQAKSPYPQWSVEALLKENPDVYFAASESVGSVGQVTKRPGFDALTAVREGRIDVVNSDLISRPGPRLVEGLSELAKDLHPEAFG